MTGYVLSIKYIGAAYTAIISALFPAVGAFLSYIFLKEKMKFYQISGLAVSIGGVILLGYTPDSAEVRNIFIGFMFALLCVLGWAAEAVIIAYELRKVEINDEQALQIRQMTSAIFYGIIILPFLKGWGMTIEIIHTNIPLIILTSALFGTASYLFYYRAINRIGAITYCALTIIFCFLLLKENLSIKDIFCAIDFLVISFLHP